MIRVAIAARAATLRAGIAALLASSETIEVVAQTASPDELLSLPPEAEIIVLAVGALRLPQWIQAVAAEEGPAVLLLVNGDEDLGPTLSLLSPRAWGVLPLDARVEEMIAAVNALAQGLIVASPELAGREMARLLGRGEAGRGTLADSQAEPLTERENQVLQLLAQGLANKQIAASLNISEHTVKFHVSAIYSKLGVASRTEAVSQGVRLGWVVL